jgi:hypothetical protein
MNDRRWTKRVSTGVQFCHELGGLILELNKLRLRFLGLTLKKYALLTTGSFMGHRWKDMTD